MISEKTTPTHLSKKAFVYLRQSSMGQVRHNCESTERQYALKDKAIQLGWPASRTEILDRDLGQSGTSTTNREDFKKLVAEVSLGNAGAVFAIEASRLARSNADWHRLIEICGIAGTLIVDEDGCYDPSDFNDGLLLGLKGAMAQAELHFLHSRLHGGKLNKAKKGELRFPLPVGYVFDQANRIIKDPDQQVRHAIEIVFSAFRQTGSAYGVVQRFSSEKLLFPKRSYGGQWAGKLQWGRLTDSRVLGILKNPSYAGIYAFGRYRSVKQILQNGDVRLTIAKMPREDWLVEIRDHHEGYTSFEQHLKNLDTLERNRTNEQESILSGPAREGLALLQGLLICRHCGRRLTTRYRGNGGIYPIYECNWRKREGLSTTSCVTIGCGAIDRAIESRVLQVINEDNVNLALDAFHTVERQQQEISTQWKLRLERAQYESDLAQRRYEQVDPANRLVASTLEQCWNDSLIELEDVRDQIAMVQESQRIITAEQRDEVLKLAEDLPRLWHSGSSSSKDKKRILQLLIEDITIERHPPNFATMHVRWQGGRCEDVTVELPRKSADRWRHGDDVIQRVRELAKDNSDAEIAARFNAEKLKSNKGNEFTHKSIAWIRHKHSLPATDKKEAGELTVKEVSQRFGVKAAVVYGWISEGLVSARRLTGGSPYWITINSEAEKTLKNRAKSSRRVSHR